MVEKKKFWIWTTIILVFLITILIGLAVGDLLEEGYIIDGNSVYWLVPGNFKLTATPHTITGDGCLILTLQNLGSERTIDIATRFNPDNNLKPKALYLQNNLLHTISSSMSCNGSYGIINATHGWCNETIYNGTWHGSYWEHEYTDYEIYDNGVLFNYNEEIELNWQKINPQHALFNGNNIYYFTDVTFEENESKTVKLCLDRDIKKDNVQKFDIFMKLTSDTLQEAFDNDRYVMLDPWSETLTLSNYENNVWRFEQSGSDEMDNQNLGEYGNVNYTTYKLDGDYAYSPNGSTYLYNESFSHSGLDSLGISLWVQHYTNIHTGTSNDVLITMCQDGITNANNLEFNLNHNDDKYYFSVRGCDSSISNGTMDLSDGWHNVILIFNNETDQIELYFDGLLSGSTGCGTIDAGSTQTRVYLGQDYQNQDSNKFWNGVIDRTILKKDYFNTTEIASLNDCGWLYCPLIANPQSPTNNTLVSTNNTLYCNSSYIISNLSNITVNIWNSTGVLYYSETNDTSGLENSTSYDIVFNYTDNFTWGCSAIAENNDVGNSEYNFTIRIDADNPLIDLDTANDTYFDHSDYVSMNCTFNGDNLGAGFLYGNFNGSWHLNQTLATIIADYNYIFNITNLSDGSYKWTCAANKTTDATVTYSDDGNYTFTIDTVLPNLTINSVSTTQGSQTVSFNFTAEDSNLDSCKYTVYNSSGSVDGLNSNASTDCSSLGSATVSDYATYELRVYATDRAGNENTTNTSFTTEESVNGDKDSGVGGGTTEITIINVSGNLFPEQISQPIIIFPNQPFVFDVEGVVSSTTEVDYCKALGDSFNCSYEPVRRRITVTYNLNLNEEGNKFIFSKNDTVQVYTLADEMIELPVFFSVYNFNYYLPLDSSMSVGFQKTNILLAYSENGQLIGIKLFPVLVILLIVLSILYYIYSKRINKYFKKLMRR